MPNSVLIPRLGRFSLVFSIQVAVTSFVYGIYCVFFGMAILALRRKLQSSPRMRFVLIILILMFLFATGILGLIYTLYYFPLQRLMFDAGSQESPEWKDAFSKVNSQLAFVDNAQYLATMIEVFLADILIVARVWFLCHNKRVLHILLVAPCIGSLGCIIAYIVAFSQGRQMDQTLTYWNLMPPIDLGLSILVNITALWITLAQTISYYRTTRKSTLLSRQKGGRLIIMTVLKILIQSGSLYILFWILFIVAWSPFPRPNLAARIMVTVFSDIGSQVVGIYPCILIVMLHNSAWKLEYVDYDDTLEMPSLPTIDTSTAVTTPGTINFAGREELSFLSERTNVTDTFISDCEKAQKPTRW